MLTHQPSCHTYLNLIYFCELCEENYFNILITSKQTIPDEVPRHLLLLTRYVLV